MSLVGNVGGGGSTTLLASEVVSGAAVTSVSFSGLDLSAYKAFWLIGTVLNATGSNLSIRLYNNSDTTEANYTMTRLNVTDAAGTVVSNSSTGQVGIVNANKEGILEVLIMHTASGDVRRMSRVIDDTGTSLRMQFIGSHWPTVANVTALEINSSVASSIDVGSSFYLYGVS